jgi:hypothetical protein
MKFLGITALVCGLAAADHYYANPNEGVEQYIVDPRCGAAFDYTSGGPVTHEVPSAFPHLFPIPSVAWRNEYRD